MNGFQIAEELSKMKKNHRVSFKWWVFHVYKKYDDGREHHIGHFTTRKQVERFLKGKKEREE